MALGFWPGLVIFPIFFLFRFWTDPRDSCLLTSSSCCLRSRAFCLAMSSRCLQICLGYGEETGVEIRPILNNQRSDRQRADPRLNPNH